MLASLLADLFELSDVILIAVDDEPLPPVAGGVYLELFHGRADPAQTMADWGDQGPVFGPFEGVHTTYAEDIKLVKAGDNCGTLRVVDDLVYYAGMYYGDWAVMGADQLTPALLARLQVFNQTQAVLPVTATSAKPVRVYYNTRRPFGLRMPDSPALDPADYEAVIALNDPTLQQPDEVWARLNEDERPGGLSFRSMCSGDVIEINGVLHECLSSGWRVVDPVAANTLRQRFGLPTHSLPGEHIQNFVAAFDAWTVSPEGIAGPLFDQVLAARETVGHVQPVA